MTPREERGMVIAAVCRLNRDEKGQWLVPSQSGAEKIYRVNLEAKRRDTKRVRLTRNPCRLGSCVAKSMRGFRVIISHLPFFLQS